jgi:hypothetical protein
VKSRATSAFWAAYRALPVEIQDQARRAYGLFRDNPGHPSLRFKRVSDRDPIYSARITINYRALGFLAGDEIIWTWIGNHEAYDRLIGRL